MLSFSLIKPRLNKIPSITRLGGLSSRMYHSIQHENNLGFDQSNIQYKILNKAIEEYLPTYGFNEISILESSRSLGYNDSIIAIFNDSKSLLQFYLKKQRLKLLSISESLEFQSLQTEIDKIKYLVHKRLELNEPYIKHINQLQSNLLLWENLESSFEELHQLSDDILFYSGDKSNDFDWYLKRANLSKDYVILETFMSQDKSENFNKTWALLDKKFNSEDSWGQAFDNTAEFLKFNAISTWNLIKSQASRG
ncbi:hypothetical protein WICMUC_004607 [Wickerhamomyces mucosus]|uniref:Ubiquinone biosynthesis protein n=1 Tax=Wickerhamomyces mucosus TaxID=1378264 RepID=A0A9P8PHL8_9ASCO|nr:hypothetical protein WICMUC_004607 [Wickerhamomyces mucosus]